MSLIANLMETPHTFAVVGVSQDPTRYGYELFEVLTKQGHTILPINPKYADIDGQTCYPSLHSLPQKPNAVISAISPNATINLAKMCADLKISILWMPPGTESDEALHFCEENQIKPIHGICPVFVTKLPRERWNELP